jgi:hypothetical protein
MHVDQFRPVIRTLFEIQEGRSIITEEIPDNSKITHVICSIVVSDDIDVKHVPKPDLGNPPTVEYEEGALPGSSWTHRQLCNIKCWPKWKKAETT